jgi:hypothetical protein
MCITGWIAIRSSPSCSDEVQETASEVRREAQEDQAARDEEIAEANQDAREKSAEAQAEANEKIRAANTDSMPLDLRTWARRQVDDLSNDIDAASVKAQKASASARSRFEAEITSVRRERDQLLGEFASIENRVGEDARVLRDSVSARVERLKDRVRELERRL